MPDELVIDASVAAKIFFTEDGSEAARALAVSGQRFCAPEFTQKNCNHLRNAGQHKLRRQQRLEFHQTLNPTCKIDY